VLGAYNTSPRPASEDDIRLPAHIRAYFEMHGVGTQAAVEGAAALNPIFLADEVTWARELERGECTCWTNKGLSHEDDAGADGDDDGDDTESECGCSQSSCVSVPYGAAYKHHEAAGGRVVQTIDEAMEVVRNCSMLVGMHPDQAAEHLVEFALRNNKPFVVVPCCVYQKQFPKRHLKDKRQVRVYGELIEYLMEKDPGIRALSMDFDGKNVLLYHLGQESPINDPELPATNICSSVATPDVWWRLSKQTS